MRGDQMVTDNNHGYGYDRVREYEIGKKVRRRCFYL